MRRILTATVIILAACGAPTPEAVPLPPPPTVAPAELPGIQVLASEVPDPQADGPVVTSKGEIDPTTTTSSRPQDTTTTTVAPTTTTVPTTTTTATQPAPRPITTTTSTTAPAPPPEAVPDPAAETQFLSLVNGLRSSRGVPPLSMDGSLRSYARSWSVRMATTGTFAHSNISSLLDPWSAVAENIATGAGVASLFDALVASPSHLENMLNPAYGATGVGVAVDADGVVWITQVFAG